MGLLDIGQIAAAVDNIKRRAKLGLLDPALAFARANEDAKTAGDADYDRLQRQFKSALPETRAQAGQETRNQGYDLMTQLLGIGAIKYPQAEALETARKNAVKMLGLPENNTAADRARAMGFDTKTKLYHGTSSDFPSFHTSARQSAYFADDPAIADIYAKARSVDSSVRNRNAGPNVMPVYTRAKNELTVSDARDGNHGWLTDNLQDALKTDQHRGLYDIARQRGHDRVKITDMMDLGPDNQRQYVVMDPKNIRSIFAAFDPARANESDLLAAIMAMGIGVPTVAGLLSERE